MMTQITAREFAILCRSDPNLYAQTVAIPGSIEPEKIIALAERNGYQIMLVVFLVLHQIMPEKGCPLEGQIELLNEDMLDAVSGGGGGLTQQEKLDALHTWIYYVMGFGDH